MTVYEASIKQRFVNNLIEITESTPEIWGYKSNTERDSFCATLNGKTIICSETGIQIEGESITTAEGLEELYALVTKAVVEHSSWYNDCVMFLKDSLWNLN